MSSLELSTTMNSVRLEPLTTENIKAVYDLRVAPAQEQFVAPNSWSLAQALVEHEVAWPRAIVAGSDVVGFLMLEIDPKDEDGQPFWLWRLMIGAEFQRRGIGTAVMEQAYAEVRRRDGTELYTSWVPGEGSPGPFYLKHRFVPTGEIDDGEMVARRTL